MLEARRLEVVEPLYGLQSVDKRPVGMLASAYALV
jgi:hypothetical protein